jgi:uncharacterized protein YjhX (UPF0386 family)
VYYVCLVRKYFIPHNCKKTIFQKKKKKKSLGGLIYKPLSISTREIKEGKNISMAADGKETRIQFLCLVNI